MAGPNLEVFKFGLYLFFPLAVMVHYGDPDWYRQHVLPIRDQFWPKENTLFVSPETVLRAAQLVIYRKLNSSALLSIYCAETTPESK